MNLLAAQSAPLWPAALYFFAVLAMVIGIIAFSHVLGERRRGDGPRNTPYESGMDPTGSARLRFSADFYLVAMFFVIFDLESVFIFAWAVATRQTGWTGYAEVAVFIGVLLAGLAYLWRSGALEWGSGALSMVGIQKSQPAYGNSRRR